MKFSEKPFILISHDQICFAVTRGFYLLLGALRVVGKHILALPLECSSSRSKEDTFSLISYSPALDNQQPMLSAAPPFDPPHQLSEAPVQPHPFARSQAQPHYYRPVKSCTFFPTIHAHPTGRATPWLFSPPFLLYGLGWRTPKAF